MILNGFFYFNGGGKLICVCLISSGFFCERVLMGLKEIPVWSFATLGSFEKENSDLKGCFCAEEEGEE